MRSPALPVALLALVLDAGDAAADLARISRIVLEPLADDRLLAVEVDEPLKGTEAV